MNINPESLAKRRVKVCPLVLNEQGNQRCLLVFRHPLAGIQLIKGTMEPGESVESAAARELWEESGVESIKQNYLGSWYPNYEDQEWHFVECKVKALSKSWQHFTKDGGGLTFSFFWHPVQSEASDEWHEVYQRALIKIRSIY
jgi:8-oxo-dGTP pyrophosphatase MutT (NUDIX family)